MQPPARAAAPPRATVTHALIAINVLAFAWEYLSRLDFDSGESLVAHGALFGPYVTQNGEWWRLVTSAFLHFNIAHIALNMFALVQIGRAVEFYLGHWRMLAIYTIAMLGGSYAVVVFAPESVTLGASGAIFGLFGALVAIGLRLGKNGRPLIVQMIPVLVINLIFTFQVAEISKAGHIGGLFAGFFAGLLFFVRPPAPPAPVPAVVVDTETGEAQEAELLEPEAPRPA